MGGIFLFAPENKPAEKNKQAQILEPVLTHATSIPSPAPTTKIKFSTTTSSNSPPSITPAPALTSTTTTQVKMALLASTSTTTSTTNTTSTIVLTPSATPELSSEQSEKKVNINTANSQELEKITGVGPVIAQRIIDYRQKNGPFLKIEDVKNVNGIGDIKFEKMKNEITI